MSDKVLDFQSQIKHEPIRQYAQAYGMNTPLPKTQAEFVAKLYEFGFHLNGYVEEMMNRTLKLQADLQKVAAMPVTYTPNRIVEMRDNHHEFMGMAVEVNDRMPPDQIVYVSGGKVVGRMTNIGKAEVNDAGN